MQLLFSNLITCSFELSNEEHFSNEDSAFVCLSSYIEKCTKSPLNYGHLCNEDSAYCPSYIEMCTKLPLK